MVKAMQKVVKINTGSIWDIEELNKKYLDKNWNIVKTIKIGENSVSLIFILQKDTRKEKLQKLENLNNEK